MKQILVITRTVRETVEDMRTLQGWILKYTVFKMGIEPRRGRITTEHAEVIFASAQIKEKLLGRHPDAVCKRTYLDNSIRKSFEAKKPDLKYLPGIEGVLREIIEIEEAAVNEKKEN